MNERHVSRPEAWMYRHERWMYPDRRPNRVAAFLNRAWAMAGLAGIWGSRLVTLEVRGRTSGRRLSCPLIVADLGSQRYLVSMLGERASWVANVRAAGGSVILRHGQREAVHLEEVDPAERGPVLRRYLEVAPAARPFSPVDRRDPLEAFDAIAADYPVFRICAAAPGGGRVAAAATDEGHVR
jgi:deazaflavin-dependent oxidoreductase (nitroreductase family)